MGSGVVDSWCCRCGVRIDSTHGATKCVACRGASADCASLKIIENMPADVELAAAWLRNLVPASLRSVWVASAVHFAIEDGIRPLSLILNAVRERLDPTPVIIVKQLPPPAPRAVKPPTVRSCRQCGAGFAPKNGVHAWCSTQCRDAQKEAPGISPRPCVVCGVEFRPRRLGMSHCSHSCRAKRHKAKA